MIEDPIVEEIHKIREKILSDCGDDLDKLLDRYKLAEEQDRTKLVSIEMLKDNVKTAK